MHRIHSKRFWGLLAASLLLLAPAGALGQDEPGLQQLQTKVQDVVAKATEATVAIASGPGMGSGVIISEDGLVLTAGHVMLGTNPNREPPPDQEIVVIFNSGRRVLAKRLGANRYRDAAMLQLQDEGPWPYTPVGDWQELEQGDWVVSLGHPGGFEPGRLPPARLGRVLQATDGPLGIISDCTLIGGDSGGPLFNLDGEVVGIHSSIGPALAENRHVPIGVFRRDWQRLAKGDRWGELGELKIDPNSGYLGVGIVPADGGVEVDEIYEESAAEQAGFQVGDKVTSIDGYPIENTFSLVETVASRRAGDKVQVQLDRQGKLIQVDVTLGEREP